MRLDANQEIPFPQIPRSAIIILIDVELVVQAS